MNNKSYNIRIIQNEMLKQNQHSTNALGKCNPAQPQVEVRLGKPQHDVRLCGNAVRTTTTLSASRNVVKCVWFTNLDELSFLPPLQPMSRAEHQGSHQHAPSRRIRNTLMYNLSKQWNTKTESDGNAKADGNHEGVWGCMEVRVYSLRQMLGWLVVRKVC